MELVTLEKADPQFHTYLSGSFSKNLRAIPFQTSNLNLQTEKVTFKIMSKEEVGRPFGILALQSFGWSRLVISFLPAMATIAFAYFKSFAAIQLPVVAALLVCLFSFHLAVSLFNDYHDYILGVDRVDETNPRNPLKRGWFRAVDFYRAAWVAIGLCFASFLYLLTGDLGLVALAFPGALIGLELAFNFLGVKYIGFSEIILFIFLGPLLIGGIERTLLGTWSVTTLVFGCFWGVSAVEYIFLKQIRNIYSDSKANITTLAIACGFDRAKVLYGALILFGSIFLGLWIHRIGEPMFTVVLVVHVVMGFMNAKMVVKSRSFLSSHLAFAQSQLQMRYWIVGLCICCLAWIS